MSGVPLERLEIGCAENAVGEPIYDHFPWLETTLLHGLSVFTRAQGRDDKLKNETNFFLRVFRGRRDSNLCRGNMPRQISHENYKYRQIWSRSARNGSVFWSWPSGQSRPAGLG
jgi:hypothetical protein